MRAYVWAALAVVWLALAGPSQAADRSEAIHAAVEPLRAAASVPALGLAVIDKGEVVFEGGFGEIGGRPATAHDRFRAASISKLFTAQAVMQLVDRRQLRLDDDVGRWLPAFAGKGLTVRRLLTHHSGLRDAIFPLETDDPARLGAYLTILAGQPLARPPGAAYAYTDADYNLLGAVVAAVSGASFTAYVQAHLLDPLKLAESSPFPPKGARDGIAQPFMNKPTVRPATPRPYDLAFAPSEGLVASAHDLAIWTRATLKRDSRLLSAASFQAMTVGQDDGGGTNRYAALGWQMRYEGERLVAEHAGSVRGFNALVVTYPEEKRAIIILTNADDAPRWEIARAVDGALGR